MSEPTNVIGADGRLTCLLARVRMADGTVVSRSALFVPPNFVPIDELLAGLGCERDSEGMIKVNMDLVEQEVGAVSAGAPRR